MNSQRNRDGRRRAAGGRPRAAARRWPLLRHSLVLAKRGLINIIRTPEALIDVTLQPIIFLLMFTYIFGGAIAHGSTARLPAVPAAGDPGPDDRDGRDRHRGQPQQRHHQGDLRPVPQPAHRPLGAAGRRRPGRRRALRDPLCRHASASATCWGSAPTRACSRCWPRACCRSAFALCLCWASVFVGMIARTAGSVQGIMTLIVLPLSFGSNTFVPTKTMPGLAAVLRQCQPADPPGGSGARPAARRAGGLPRALDAGLDGRPAGGVRSSGDARLPPPGVTP